MDVGIKLYYYWWEIGLPFRENGRIQQGYTKAQPPKSIRSTIQKWLSIHWDRVVVGFLGNVFKYIKCSHPSNSSSLLSSDLLDIIS